MTLISRAYPGDMAAGNGLTFRAALNADRTLEYGGIDALETMLELLGITLLTTGTLPANTAVLTIDSPTAGRVYCPTGFLCMVGGVPVITIAALSQAYTASALNHVFLVVGTDGALSLRCGATTTAAANECWIGDVTAVPAVDMAPAGKPIALVSLGTAADGTRPGILDGKYQTLTTSATPDAENTIAHELGRVPVGYLVVRTDKACAIYAGATGWGTANIYLKASVASAAITVLVF